MTTHSGADMGQDDARRLKHTLLDLEALLARPDVQLRLRQSPGADEWSALETLGHCVEMVPFWVRQCQGLIAAAGDPPPFGRTLDSPERLEGVERGKQADPEPLLADFRREVEAASSWLIALSPEDRQKAGVHPRRGRMTVDDVIRIFIVEHAEDHVGQVRAALGG
jgi:hypothetical protein